MFDFQHKALQEPQKERVGKKKKKRGQEAKARKKAEEPGILGGTKV